MLNVKSIDFKDNQLAQSHNDGQEINKKGDIETCNDELARQERKWRDEVVDNKIK